jgi:hypothetical protein
VRSFAAIGSIDGNQTFKSPPDAIHPVRSMLWHRPLAAAHYYG